MGLLLRMCRRACWYMSGFWLWLWVRRWCVHTALKLAFFGDGGLSYKTGSGRY